MIWDGYTAGWWHEEVHHDPAYGADVDPLLDAVLPGRWHGAVLDVGCGDGRLADQIPGWIGVDSSIDLVRLSPGGACVADASRLPFADSMAAGSVSVLVLEHLEDLNEFFAETRRVVMTGGFLAVVVNHPIYTAPDSGPFVDPDDGEVLWRWGTYLDRGFSDQPTGRATVRFHHRPLGELLTAAASWGWMLEVMEERPLSPKDDPLLATQQQVPRLVGLRWRAVALRT